MESRVMEGLSLALRWFFPVVLTVLLVRSLSGRNAAKALQSVNAMLLPLNDGTILIALALLASSLPDALLLDSMPVVVSSTVISVSLIAVAMVPLRRAKKALKAAGMGTPRASLPSSTET